MSERRLIFVALRVADLERSARFYRDAVGVPLEPTDQPGEAHEEYSWREGAYLHFALFPAGTAGPSERAELDFSVDDLDQAHERMVEAGAPVVRKQHDAPWGLSAVYRDPDGNLVGLTERR